MVYNLLYGSEMLTNINTGNPDDQGPMKEYNARVALGQLRDDEHQRGQQDTFHTSLL